MLPQFTSRERQAVLGGMYRVASADGAAAVTDADRASLRAAHRYVFRQRDTLDIATLPAVGPAELAAAVRHDPAVADHALRFLTVMAFVDGRLDRLKIAAVLAYAGALGIEEDYLTETAEAAAGHLQWALADMARRNIESLTGAPWASADVLPWLLPYRGSGADPVLAARYEALSALPAGSFGRTFWEFYRAQGYALPGGEAAINEMFAVPHDSTHILAGYDTSGRGEILVSTFTAAMHGSHPMSGHILPVIFSWHLGIEINEVARSAKGGLDPEEFWHAWERGAMVDIDLFGPAWNFWEWTAHSVDELRRRHLRDP